MKSSLFVHCALVLLSVALVGLCGCPAPSGNADKGGTQDANTGTADTDVATPEPAAASTETPASADAPAKNGDTQPATEKPEPEAPAGAADAADVEAAKQVLDKLGAGARYTVTADGVMTEIVIPDGSMLTPDDIALFGRLTDLETLQILNYRKLNDEMAATLSGLKNLKKLALTNSTIGDPTVEMIAASFPGLTELDLSSNTNMTNSVLKVIATLEKLERLALVQNRFNDLGTGYLENLKGLRVLDLRGNMEAGDMTLEIVATLPKLVDFKHRSTTVTDYGIECLANSKTLKSLLMQDFGITGPVGTVPGTAPRSPRSASLPLPKLHLRWRGGAKGDEALAAYAPRSSRGRRSSHGSLHRHARAAKALPERVAIAQR